MALVKETLKTAIEAAFKAQAAKTSQPEAALSDLADRLATALDAFIKSAQVTGTCATPAGAGTIFGTIS
jgi:hypothetical protein